jgi:hypothetical protein
MADKQPDPTEAFRKLVSDWERGFDTMANKIMGTDEFSQSMNQFQNLQLAMQKRFNEAMAQHLLNLNMPSRDDILRLGESIRSVEKRLASIEATLATKKKKKKSDQGSRQKPPRTKLPPSMQSEQSYE